MANRSQRCLVERQGAKIHLDLAELAHTCELVLGGHANGQTIPSNFLKSENLRCLPRGASPQLLRHPSRNAWCYLERLGITFDCNWREHPRSFLPMRALPPKPPQHHNGPIGVESQAKFRAFDNHLLDQRSIRSICPKTSPTDDNCSTWATA